MEHEAREMGAKDAKGDVGRSRRVAERTGERGSGAEASKNEASEASAKDAKEDGVDDVAAKASGTA